MPRAAPRLTRRATSAASSSLLSTCKSGHPVVTVQRDRRPPGDTRPQHSRFVLGDGATLDRATQGRLPKLGRSARIRDIDDDGPDPQHRTSLPSSVPRWMGSLAKVSQERIGGAGRSSLDDLSHLVGRRPLTGPVVTDVGDTGFCRPATAIQSVPSADHHFQHDLVAVTYRQGGEVDWRLRLDPNVLTMFVSWSAMLLAAGSSMPTSSRSSSTPISSEPPFPFAKAQTAFIIWRLLSSSPGTCRFELDVLPFPATHEGLQPGGGIRNKLDASFVATWPRNREVALVDPVGTSAQ